MASTIKLKNGSGAPLAGDLVQGEPALDLTNKRLYTEDSGGNVIEVGVNPTSITTGTITASGEITANGGIALGDNDKATFGASDDLQIWHDGSNSYISDLNTGDLVLQSNGTRIGLASASPFEWMLEANTNGSVTAYYDGSVKLATTATGIDVTGTVTADGLTVENAGGSAKAVIKSTTTAGGQTQYLNASTGTTGFLVGLLGDTSGNGTLFHQDAKDILVYTNGLKRANFGSGGDISFYEDTGTTAKFFWDASAEHLGVGTTSPSAKLHIDTYNQGSIAIFEGNAKGNYPPDLFGGSIGYNFSDAGAEVDFWNNWTGANSTQGGFKFRRLTGASSSNELMYIRGDGNVGIGTSSPGQLLHLASSDPRINIEDTDAGGIFQIRNTSGAAYLVALGAHPMIFSTNSSEAMRIDSSGNVGIGTTSPAEKLTVAGDINEATIQIYQTQSSGSWVDGDNIGAIEFSTVDGSGAGAGVKGSIRYATTGGTGADTYMSFGVADASTNNDVERIRIDSSGNVGIGVTSVGDKLEIGGAGSGIILASPDGTRYRITVANGGTLTVSAV